MSSCFMLQTSGDSIQLEQADLRVRVCYTVVFLSYLKWAQLEHTYLVACIRKYGSDKSYLS